MEEKERKWKWMKMKKNVKVTLVICLGFNCSDIDLGKDPELRSDLVFVWSPKQGIVVNLIRPGGCEIGITTASSQICNSNVRSSMNDVTDILQNPSILCGTLPWIGSFALARQQEKSEQFYFNLKNIFSFVNTTNFYRYSEVKIQVRSKAFQ